MKTYEESLSIWGARQLGISDDTATEVSFEFEASFLQGCETCGPESEMSFGAFIKPEGGKSQYINIGRDYSIDFGEIVQEIVAISQESV